jgi:hypothetical protein
VAGRQDAQTMLMALAAIDEELRHSNGKSPPTC